MAWNAKRRPSNRHALSELRLPPRTLGTPKAGKGHFPLAAESLLPVCLTDTPCAVI